MSISAANQAWKAEAEKRREKQEQSRNLPSRFQGSTSPYLYVLIVGGNELETGQQGVVYMDGAGVETVPSAYDPDVTSSFTNGIGRGTLYKNGVAQDGYVLVVNDDRGSFRNALVENDVVLVGDAVSIPVSGGGAVTAYPTG